MSTADSAAAAQPGVRQRRGGSMMWVQGLACGALLTFATPTALLLTILLAPAILCLLANPGCERGLLRAVASSCIAGSLAPLWHLWVGGGHMDDVALVLASPATLCIAWGGGAAAWSLCQILPVIVQAAWDGREANRTNAIQAELEGLGQEWSLTQTAEPK